MIKVGLVDDYRVDLEKLHAIVGRMEAVDIIFVTQSAEDAYEKVKKETLICCSLTLKCLECPAMN